MGILNLNNIKRVIIMAFYEELSKYYDIVFLFSQIKLDFIKKRINGEKILDLAAGTGDYSIALGKLGYDVTAADLDEEMVEKIKGKSQLDKINIKSIKLDMKDIDKLDRNYFNLIFCIGNSLVHLQSINEIHKVIKKIYNALDVRGTVIIQIINYDRIFKYNVKELPLINRKKEGVEFVRKYELKDEKVLFKTKLIVNNSKSYDNCIELYPLTTSQLVDVLKDCGFKNIELYGGFDESEYSIDSFHTIAVAHKC